MTPDEFLGEMQRLLIEGFAVTERLHPVEYLERLDDWHRAGLPASSMPEGRRGGETPIPVNTHGDRDRHDVTVEQKQAAYLRGIGNIIKQMRDLRMSETGVIPEYHMTKQKYEEYHARVSMIATQLESWMAAQCANPRCRRDIKKQPKDSKAGRCINCYEYRRTTGSDRSHELCQVDIERDLEVAAAEKRARSGKRARVAADPRRTRNG